MEQEAKRVMRSGSWRSPGKAAVTPAARQPMRWLGPIAAAALLAAIPACGPRQPADVQIRNPWLGAMRVAVAPALNFSGSADVDVLAAADVMAGELARVDGFEVLPVSRTLAVLNRQGATGVESPAHALEIRDALGADAILVFAITEYDPYEPPSVGIAAQLYGSFASERVPRFDPVRVSRSATPVSGGVARPAWDPIAQVTAVRNAANEPVVREVRDFARVRDGDGSPYGWRKYLVSQRSYLRFCCHAAIRDLVQRGVAVKPPDAPPQTG